MIPISKRSLMSGIMLLSFAFLSWYGIGCGYEEALEGEEPVATTRWEYPDPGAPENWGSLTDEFRTCEAGVEQSPVNLAGYALSDAAPPPSCITQKSPWPAPNPPDGGCIVASSVMP